MQSTIQNRQVQKEQPDRSHVMYQTWTELLFLHWKIEPEKIQATLPPGLVVDTFQGEAWVGIVPFFMKDVRPRYLPAVPGISNFMELNVRTYVVDSNGLPGVWFYSLDCNQPLAVSLARSFFHLPYENARMNASTEGTLIKYHCKRNSEKDNAYFEYQKSGRAEVADEDSLESFLVDRYWLFSFNERKGELFKGRVWHSPYEVGKVNVAEWSNLPLKWNGLATPKFEPDHILRAENLKVQIYPIERA